MNKAFEINGFWWLPESPQTKIPGTLSFSPGNILRLNLMGALNEIEEKKFPSSNFINPNIILGISSEGKSVTLIKCLQTGGFSSFSDAGSFYSTKFIVHIAFFGVHLFSSENILFSSITVKFHNLDNWYNESLIKSVIHDSNSSSFTFKDSPSIEIELEDYLIQLVVYISQNYELNNISLNTNVLIEISSKFEKSFEDYMNLTRLIQNFLTFSISNPTFVTEMHGRIGKDEIGEEKNSSVIDVEIFYGAVGWQPVAHNIFWADMLIPYKEIESDFARLLKNWIEKAEILKPVYDLYFASSYRAFYPENEFLNLTQALETYHRRTYDGKFQSDEYFFNGLYKKLVSCIPSDLSEDFKLSLINGKLKYANEYSLRKRILLLSEHVAENMSLNFIHEKNKRILFAETVTNTRNYLTHYSPDLKEKAITSGEDLFKLNQQLDLLLKFCLLEELGIPFQKINELLKRDKNYKENFISPS